MWEKVRAERNSDPYFYDDMTDYEIAWMLHTEDNPRCKTCNLIMFGFDDGPCGLMWNEVAENLLTA